MTEALALPFFRTALIASLVLAGIHAYLEQQNIYIGMREQLKACVATDRE